MFKRKPLEDPSTPGSRDEYFSASSPIDDSRDEDYNDILTPLTLPGPRRYNSNYQTPPGRNKQGSSLSARAREAAMRADPNEGRCLITNQELPVEAAHVIPNSTGKNRLTGLEWAWGMPLGTLNVSTRENIFFLRNDFHHLFDHDYWLLLPRPDILNSMWEWFQANKPGIFSCRNRTNITSIYQKNGKYPAHFNYIMLPIKEMRGVPITYLKRAVNPANIVTYQHQTFFYPYDELGAFRSHVLPHFFIYNAGSKLAKLSEAFIANNIASVFQIVTNNSIEDPIAYLDKISKMYRIWMIEAPEAFTLPQHSAGSSGSGSGRGDSSRRHDYGTRSSFRGSDGGGGGGGGGGGPIIPQRGGQQGGWFASNRHLNLGINQEMSQQDIPALWNANSHDASEEDAVEEAYDSMDEDYETNLAEDIKFAKKFVSRWWRTTVEIVEYEGGWEASVLNDSQIGPYTNEPCRSPYQEWGPIWIIRGGRDMYKPEPDTRYFSSNDWPLHFHHFGMRLDDRFTECDRYDLHDY